MESPATGLRRAHTRSLIITLPVLAFVSMTALTASPLAHHSDVDPLRQKPLPTRRSVGAVSGVAVDASDHVWLMNNPATRQPAETRSDWCATSSIFEFGQDGRLVCARDRSGHPIPGDTISSTSLSSTATMSGLVSARKGEPGTEVYA